MSHTGKYVRGTHPVYDKIYYNYYSRTPELDFGGGWLGPVWRIPARALCVMGFGRVAPATDYISSP